MTKIKFKIVTPERVVYEDMIDQAIVPTAQGQITVLPNHIPLVSLLMAGELIVKKDGNEIPMAVSSGFVQVNKNEIIVLADTSEHAREIDITRADEARERAVRLMKDMKNKEDVNYTALLVKMEKELARVRVARKRKFRAHDQDITT